MDQDPAQLPAEIPHPIFAVVSEAQTRLPECSTRLAAAVWHYQIKDVI